MLRGLKVRKKNELIKFFSINTNVFRENRRQLGPAKVLNENLREGVSTGRAMGVVGVALFRAAF